MYLGPGYGKFLYDPAGSHWENTYEGDCIKNLEEDAQDLINVADEMNKIFVYLKDKNSTISCRHTLVTPSVEHSVSKWESLDKTTTHFCYFLSPEYPDGVHQRLYRCFDSHCKASNSCKFLDCKNVYAGKWKYHDFTLKAEYRSESESESSEDSSESSSSEEESS